MLQPFFDDLQARLLAIQNTTTPTAAAVFKYVDFNWGQMDFFEGNPPVKFPCALYDLRNYRPTDVANGFQIGTADIEISVYDLPTTNTSGAAPATQRAIGMRILECVNELQKHLHGWEATAHGEHYGPLTRIEVNRVKRRDQIRQYTVVYRIQTRDAHGHQQRTTRTATIVPIP